MSDGGNLRPGPVFPEYSPTAAGYGYSVRVARADLVAGKAEAEAAKRAKPDPSIAVVSAGLKFIKRGQNVPEWLEVQENGDIENPVDRLPGLYCTLCGEHGKSPKSGLKEGVWMTKPCLNKNTANAVKRHPGDRCHTEAIAVEVRQPSASRCLCHDDTRTGNVHTLTPALIRAMIPRPSTVPTTPTVPTVTHSYPPCPPLPTVVTHLHRPYPPLPTVAHRYPPYPPR